MWCSPYEKLDEVKCKKHPTYKVMRQPRVPCDDCWVAWIERNIQTPIRGEQKEFLLRAMAAFTKQSKKVDTPAKERTIDDIIDDDPYADIIRGS